MGTLLRIEAWAKSRELELVAINFELEMVVVRGLPNPEPGCTYHVHYGVGLPDDLGHFG